MEDFSLEGALLNGTEFHYDTSTTNGPQRHSDIVDSYWNVFSESITSKVKGVVNGLRQTIASHGLELMDQTDQARQLMHESTINISVQKMEWDGALLTYLVMIGPFKLKVRMVNLGCKVGQYRQSKNRGSPERQLIEIQQKESSYTIQRIYSQSNEITHEEVLDAVCEYAMTAICSALKIGPSIPSHHFDLVCFDNAIQFACERPGLTPALYTSDLQERLLYCLRLMHEVGLAHNSISPRSVVYSPTLKEFVLGGFGSCSYSGEGPGGRTLTFREGWFRWMSEEMKNGKPGTRSLVDLFSNDVCSLGNVLEGLRLSTNYKADCKQQIVWSESEDFDSDKLCEWLYSRLTTSHKLPIPKVGRFLFQTALKSFPTLFKESTLQQTLPNQPINQNFLQRAFGESTPLLRRILSMENPIGTQLCYIPLYYTGSYFGASQGRPSKKAILRQLRKRTSIGESHQESLRQELALRLCLVNLTMVSKPLEAIEHIQGLLSLQSKQGLILQNILWVNGIHWLRQFLLSLLDTNNARLPNATDQLFVRPFSSQRFKMLVLSGICCYNKGDYSLAMDIAQFIVKDQQELSSSIPTAVHPRCYFLIFMGKLLTTTSVRSGIWLALAKFVIREPGTIHSLTHVAEKYQPLLKSNELSTAQRALLTQMLSLIYKEKGDKMKELQYCRQSLELKAILKYPDQDVMHRQTLQLIRLYRHFGKEELALLIVQQAILDFQMLRRHSSFARLIYVYKATALLLHLKRIEQATASYQELKLLIVNLAAPQCLLVEAISEHLAVVSLFQATNTDDEHLEELARTLLDLKTPDNRKQLDQYIDCLAHMSLLSLKNDRIKYQALSTAQRAIEALAEFTIANINSCCQWNRTQIENTWQIAVSQELLPIQQLSQECGDCRMIGGYFVMVVMNLAARKNWPVLESYLKSDGKCEVLSLSSMLTFALLQLAQWLHEQFQLTLALLLLERVEAEPNTLFIKCDILRKMAEYKMCAEVFENILSAHRGHITLRQAATVHQRLSELYTQSSNFDHELSQNHLLEACHLFKQLSAENSSDVQLMLALGLCYFKLKSYSQAIKPLGRLMTLKGLIDQRQADMKRTGVAPYAICLNAVGKCRQSLYYLRGLSKSKTKPNAQCLFYMTHNAYVLRQWRRFTRYCTKLYVAHQSEQYVTCLKEFLESRHQEERVVIMTGKAANSMLGKNISVWWKFVEGEECSKTTTKNLIQLLRLEKKVLRYGSLVGRKMQDSHQRLQLLRSYVMSS